MGRIEELAARYRGHIGAPWQRNLAGDQKAIFVVYPKTDERKLRVRYVRVDRLVPADRNPRFHDLERIRTSIRRFGFVAPLLVNEATGKLLAGHGRVQALLGMIDGGEDPPDGIVPDASGN